MNIMENKRVTALAALLAVGFIGLCYKGYESYSQLKDAQAKIAQAKSKIEDYEAEKLPPTEKNSQLLKKAATEVEQLAASLNEAISKYAVYCTQGAPAAEGNTSAYKPGVNPVAFQNRLKELSAAISAEAAGKDCRLNNGAADFGMTSLKLQAPKEVDAPYLNFLLSAVNRAERHLIAAGAPSIERVYCAPLPEEPINARTKPDYFPLSFEIAFTARRSEVIDPAKPDSFSVLPQVLNKLVNDENFFFTITGIAIATPGNLPVANGGSADAAAEAAAAEEGEAAPAAGNATLITGKADEYVNVHVNLQVLYFTKDSL